MVNASLTVTNNDNQGIDWTLEKVEKSLLGDSMICKQERLTESLRLLLVGCRGKTGSVRCLSFLELAVTYKRKNVCVCIQERIDSTKVYMQDSVLF